MAVTGMVYFCPELRLYHYQISDSGDRDNDVDYKFNADELEDALVAMLSRADDDEKKEGSQREAKFMADMTGLARVNPHKIVMLDIDKNKIEIVEPVDYWKKHDAEREAIEATASK